MEYETKRIVQDADMISILQELGYKMDLSADHQLNGDKLPIICDHHKHKDGNFGTARLIVRGGGTYKGMHCFLCASSWSLPTLVQEKLGCNYWDAIKFIANHNGGLDQYAIPGTENDWDRRVLASQGKTVEDNAFPAPLSVAECKALRLNLNVEQSELSNCAIISASDTKPNSYELESDEAIVPITIENEKFDITKPGLYASFIHYCAGVKTPNGSDEEPFKTLYLKVKRVNETLYNLYKEDKDAYWELAYYRAHDILEEVNERLEKIKDFGLIKYVNERAELKEQKQILEGIIERFTLTIPMMEVIAKQYQKEAQ